MSAIKHGIGMVWCVTVWGRLFGSDSLLPVNNLGYDDDEQVWSLISICSWQGHHHIAITFYCHLGSKQFSWISNLKHHHKLIIINGYSREIKYMKCNRFLLIKLVDGFWNVWSMLALVFCLLWLEDSLYCIGTYESWLTSTHPTFLSTCYESQFSI